MDNHPYYYWRALTIVHNRRGDILAGDALVPGRLHIQVESHFAAVLARVQQVPLELEVGIGGHVGRVAHRRHIVLVVVVGVVAEARRHRDRTQAPLDPHEARLLHGQMDLRRMRRRRTV